MVQEKKSAWKTQWRRDLLNGFIAWAIAFVLYVIPAFVVAFRMAFDLGPKLKDSAQVSALIGPAISGMYRTNPYLFPAYIAILAVLIFWRSRVVCRTAADGFLAHGAVVAAIPVAIGLLQFVAWKGAPGALIAMFVFLAAGMAGAFKSAGSSPAP